ncbi:MAG TPA: hypothetical protein VN787_04290 [Steroidobacteraceae bacterium]|nr:hypothetical protein [Steroidobacteraceae bacterium]
MASVIVVIMLPQVDEVQAGGPVFEAVIEPPPQAASKIASAGATSQRDAARSRKNRFDRISNDMMASLMKLGRVP